MKPALLVAFLAAGFTGCYPLPDYGDEGEVCFLNDTCKEGLECNPATARCERCQPDCTGKCGGSPNGCGGICDASCPAGQWCREGTCASCTTDEHCGNDCIDCTNQQTNHVCVEGQCGCVTEQDCAAGESCLDGECTGCTPDCEDKCDPEPDGCGGTCGPDCGSGRWCDNGACRPCDTPDHCGAECVACEAGQVCDGESCCTPDCDGKQCGPDGCNGSCGDCVQGQVCNESTGQCEASEPPAIVSDDIGGAVLPASTHLATFSVTFSEPVTGLAAGGVSVDGGAFVTRFETSDRITWTFDVVATYNGASFNVGFQQSIRDLQGEPLAETSRPFSVEAGPVVYASPAGGGSGDTPDDPTSLMQALESAPAGADILVSQGQNLTILATSNDTVSILCGFSSNFTDRDPESYKTSISQNMLYTTVAFNEPENGPRRILDGCTIRNDFSGTVQKCVEIIMGANPIVSRNRIESTDSTTSVGIDIDGTDADLLHNRLVNLSAAASTSYIGIRTGGTSETWIAGNVIDGGQSQGDTTGIAIEGPGCTLESNLVFAGESAAAGATSQSIGITIEADSALVRNNLIHGGAGKQQSDGVVCTGGFATISHNTVFAGSGTQHSAAVRILDQDAHPDLTNNILFAGTESGTCISEEGATSDPASCRNNLFVQCPDGLYLDEGLDALDAIEQVNGIDGQVVEDGTCDPGTSCEHCQFGNNAARQETADAFFSDLDGPDLAIDTLEDNDWRPAVDDPAVAEGGRDTFGADCGTLETPAPCGSVSMDLAGEPRTTPVTPGAYEQDAP